MDYSRHISKAGILAAATGGMVGSGWLFGPFLAAKMAGPASVLSWALGGVLMMVIALTFAELVATFPSKGSMVRFTHLSHGTLTSFTLAWVAWLASVMVAPIETSAALQYLGHTWPALVVHHADSLVLSSLGIFIAAAIMLILCIINCFGANVISKGNVTIVLWKVAIPVVTILILLPTHFSWQPFMSHSGFLPSGWHGVLAALPLAGVVFSFIGFSPALQLAGEAKDPARTIPFSLVCAIGIVIALYVVLQVVFVGALPPSSYANGWSHLHFSGDAGPIAGLLAMFGFMWWLKVIMIDAVISPIGTGYIYTSSTARMNMAMSDNGYLPSSMTWLNRYRSPWFAIALNYVIGMICFLPFPGWQSMVGFLVICFVLAYAIGPIACLTLRYTAPTVSRRFKVPAVSLTCYCAFTICNLMIYWTGWSVVYKLMIVTFLGYIFLWFYSKFSRKIDDFSLQQAIWLFPYLVGLGVLSYVGDYGGRHWMSFGIDMVVVALFSLVIFVVAVYCGVSRGQLSLEAVESVQHP